MTTARAGCSSRARVAVLGFGLGLALLTTAPFTESAQASGCGVDQIAVVVSFNELGGGTRTTCIDDVDTGFEALDAAGYAVTPVAGQPFVCRINDVPATDPCQRIPPATAYWAYWTAPMGGSWSYSTIGAGSADPEPGQVQGWSFGADTEPSIAPPEPTTNPGVGSADSESPDTTAYQGQGSSPSSSPSDGGTPWALLGTVAGAAVLGAAAYHQLRRRRSVPPLPET